MWSESTCVTMSRSKCRLLAGSSSMRALTRPEVLRTPASIRTRCGLRAEPYSMNRASPCSAGSISIRNTAIALLPPSCQPASPNAVRQRAVSSPFASSLRRSDVISSPAAIGFFRFAAAAISVATARATGAARWPSTEAVVPTTSAAPEILETGDEALQLVRDGRLAAEQQHDRRVVLRRAHEGGEELDAETRLAFADLERRRRLLLRRVREEHEQRGTLRDAVDPLLPRRRERRLARRSGRAPSGRSSMPPFFTSSTLSLAAKRTSRGELERVALGRRIEANGDLEALRSAGSAPAACPDHPAARSPSTAPRSRSGRRSPGGAAPSLASCCSPHVPFRRAVFQPGQSVASFAGAGRS